jgi:hypothetical protein
MDLVVLTDESFQEEADPTKELRRSVELTNEEWSVVAQCVESFAEIYRAKHSQIVTTYVTRNQLEQAVAEATKMNGLLAKLDKLQALL